MDIYLDFDGTVVEHAYPNMGRCNFGCIEIIKKLQDAGHIIYLNTYRADIGPDALNQAIRLLNENYWMCCVNKDIELQPITNILPKKVYPQPWDWDLMKSTNLIYIDDIATNIPLKPACMVQNMMVDWDKLDRQFIENKIYENR